MKSLIGQLGEDIACKFMENKGFEIIDRNYRKKWGELDIIARRKDENIRFIEVKAVSREIVRVNGKDILSHEEIYRPEDQLHPWKQQRLKRAIISYLLRLKAVENMCWQFDIILVRVDRNSKKVMIEHWENMQL